jgi:urease accessory protein
VAISIRRLGLWVAIAMAAMQTPAWAHHVMDGNLPLTFVQGFLSGLGHPVLGLDHLGAIIGVGILAALAGRGVGPIFAFSAAVIAGVGLHLAKASIPASELLVGLSTFVLGGLVVLRASMRPAIAMALFAIAGLIHGYALGESIVGAEPAPLVAYLAGLLVIQTVVSLACYAAVLNLARWPVRIIGVLVALTGGVTAAFAAGLA